MPRRAVGRRQLGGLAAAALSCALAAPALAAASVDVDTPVAQVEPPSLILPGATIQAVSADLDEDGARDLVRLVAGDDRPYHVFAEVWTDRSGEWERLGEPREVQRVGARTETTDRLLPLATEELARLVVWHESGRERVAVATAAVEDYWFVPCCFTLLGVELDADGFELRLLSGDRSSADAVVAVDLDGDGTDEMVVHGPRKSTAEDAPTVRPYLHAFSWDEGAFVPLASLELRETAGGGIPSLLGDTDGRPGEEVVIVDVTGSGALTRISLTDGALVAEVAPLDLPSTAGLDAAAVPGDPPGLVAVSHDQAVFAEWPAGGELTVTRTDGAGGRLLGVLDSERVVQVAVLDDRNGHLRLLDRLLPGVPALGVSEEADRLSGTGIEPYAGELPGGTPQGDDAIVAGGRLAVAVGARRTITFAGIASLPAAQPAGFVGRDAATFAVLHSAGPMRMEPEGGFLRMAQPFPDARLALVPASAAIGPGSRTAPPAEVTVQRATLERGGTNQWEITASRDGFAMEVHAPPGSRVVVTFADEPDQPALEASLVPESGHLALDVPRDVLPPGDDPVEAQLIVSTPAGHARVARGTVRVDAEAPRLHVDAPLAPLTSSVTITGATEPGSEVTVAGERISVEPDGTFSATVAAGLVPTDVSVTAVDALGNSVDATTSVVAFVDYRRVPWFLLGALALIGTAAVVAWRRQPAAAPAQATPQPEVGVLEEIEG